MNRLLAAALVACTIAASGCASIRPHTQSGPAGFGIAPARMAAEPSAASANRKLIWQGSLALIVGNISNAVVQATEKVKQAGGYVESSSGNETYASLTLRLPSAQLQSAIASLEQLGEVTHRNLTSTDVTEEYVDIEARRANLVVLRDRLRALLERAQDVKDIVAVEAELNRVQSELDALDARMKALAGQIDYAALNVTFHRKPILGPLGYIVKGAWWVIEKLFVIRH